MSIYGVLLEIMWLPEVQLPLLVNMCKNFTFWLLETKSEVLLSKVLLYKKIMFMKILFLTYGKLLKLQ